MLHVYLPSAAPPTNSVLLPLLSSKPNSYHHPLLFPAPPPALPHPHLRCSLASNPPSPSLSRHSLTLFLQLARSCNTLLANSAHEGQTVTEDAEELSSHHDRGQTRLCAESNIGGATTSHRRRRRRRRRGAKAAVVGSGVEGEAKAALQNRVAEVVISNAKRLKGGVAGYGARCSVGIDLGDARTGVAVSRGFVPRPIAVLRSRGEKLEAHLLQLAEKHRADELVLGLPKSRNGSETVQSNKIRSFAGRLTVRAAERGWRVYLQDEYGTSEDALDYMIEMGSKRCQRKDQVDAYAAMMILQNYFNNAGSQTELVVPKDTALQQQVIQGPALSYYDDDDGEDLQMSWD